MKNYTDKDDVSSAQAINYEEFLYYIKQGREIEFIHNNKEYFISYEKMGRVLLSDGKILSKVYENDTKFTEEVHINGISLKKIFSDKELHQIVTIY